MNYSIKPKEHQLREARNRIEQTLQTYSYCFEIEDIEINLGWQPLEKDMSFVPTDEALIITLRPGADLDKLEKNVLRGVFELEFRDKTPYKDIEFNWQEVAKFAYVKTKVAEKLGEEPTETSGELEKIWPDLKEQLSQETVEFDEKLYRNAASLGGAIGQKLLEDRDLEEFPELKKSDVIEAGDEIFS